MAKERRKIILNVDIKIDLMMVEYENCFLCSADSLKAVLAVVIRFEVKV